MTKSPPIQVQRSEVELENATNNGMPLPYIAALFKGTLQAYPEAVLLIGGSLGVAKIAQEKLEGSLGVPLNKIEIISIPDLRFKDKVSIEISYFPDASRSHNVSFKRKVCVEFEVKLDKVELEFEFSPDGALLEEAKINWSPLKALIGRQSSGGLVQNIKLAAKFSSSVSFDRQTLAKVETTIANKMKAVLSADVKIPGTKKLINVEIYGAGGSKYKLNDGTSKSVFEGGVMFTVPFDFL
jgi:hypothetical protein